MRHFLIIGGAFASLTTSAFAADTPVYPQEAAVVEASDWTGFYAGVHVGYGFGDFGFTGVVDPDRYEGLDLDDEDGVLGGGQVGYNAQFGQFVVGVEGDIAATGINPDDFDSPGGYDIEAQINFVATLRGRVGYAFGSTLIYGTGGVAFVDFDADYAGDADSDTAIGWAAGAGIEHKITENLSAKLEYLFIDAEAEDVALNPDSNIDFELQTVKVGLNYHF